jgi:DNA-binding transcriptional ArsR family regulator
MVEQSRSDDVFAAIAAPARRAMLQMLARRETPVMELAESFDMTLSAVSQHLAILRDAGLVSQRKNGRQRLYRLNPEPLRAVSEWLEFYEPFWTDRLGRLGEFLDREAAGEPLDQEQS